MLGVLRHRPIRHRNIIPKIGGACISEFSRRSVAPILRFTVGLIRCKHPSALPDGIKIKCVIIRDGGKPYIFHTVFPVFCRPSAFLTLPCDPISDHRPFGKFVINGISRAPVAAYIYRGGRFHERHDRIEPTGGIFTVLFITHRAELIPTELLCEVVRRVGDKQIDTFWGNTFNRFKHIGVYYRILGYCIGQTVRGQALFQKQGHFVVTDDNGSVSLRSHRLSTLFLPSPVDSYYVMSVFGRHAVFVNVPCPPQGICRLLPMSLFSKQKAGGAAYRFFGISAMIEYFTTYSRIFQAQRSLCSDSRAKQNNVMQKDA